MKTIILGGTGFIGRLLVTSLLNSGHEVVVVGRSPKRAERRFVAEKSERLRFAGWDGKTASGWGEEVDGADAVVNLAGENIAAGRWSPDQKKRIVDSRVQAGQAVCQTIREAADRPKALIQASAVGFYGLREDELLTEDSAPKSGSFLAETAAAWEQSTEEVLSLGVRRVVVRTGLVLGRNGGALPRMLMPFKFFVGGSLGSGRQWVSWIHLRDEVGAIMHLLQQDTAAGPYNLVAPNPLIMKHFAQAIGKAMGRPALFTAPTYALRMALGRMADELLLSGQRVSCQRLLDSGYVFAFPVIDQALGDLL